MRWSLSGWTKCRTWFVVLVFVVVMSLVVGACTTGPLPAPPPGPEGVVGAQGFTVALDDLTVVGAAGVAPEGTRVHLKVAPTLVPEGLTGVDSAGTPFDISFEGGLQPGTPVTVSMKVADVSAEKLQTLFFVTQRSDTGRWEGLPVTVANGRASVTLDHFSGGWFGWGDKVRDWFVDQVRQFLKLGYPKPDCVGKTAVAGGREYSVDSDSGGVYACVSASGASLKTSITSNSPFVWRYRPTPGQGTGLQGEAPLELAGILTVALFDAMAGYDYADETVLVPGGKATITVKQGVTDTWTGARVDAGLGLVAVLVAGLDMAAAMASGQSPTTWLDAALKKAENANKIRQAAECMAGVVEGAGGEVEAKLGQIGNTVVSCAGNVMSELAGGFVGGVVGVVVGIVTSLIGLLVTQVWGLVSVLTGQNEARLHVTSKASAVVLSSEGIGSFTFGAREADVLAFLTPILGKPTVEGGVGGCEEAGFGYQNYARFGDLSVRFAAPDNSATSKRTLASWAVRLTSRQQGRLALAPGIPFGLTYDQLRAKYPKGGGLEHMDAWFAGGVWIVPGGPGEKTLVHAGGLDWCT